MSDRSVLLLVWMVLLTAILPGCGSDTDEKSGPSTSGTLHSQKPTKTPEELFVGIWDAKLDIDIPALTKLTESRQKISTAEARKKAEDLQRSMIASKSQRQVTWQVGADGSIIVRNKVARETDSTDRRHLTWKVVSIEGQVATLEIANKEGEAEGRQIKISFRDDNTFRLDEDPKLKKLWILPVLNPVFHRNMAGKTDLTKVTAKPRTISRPPARKVPIVSRWTNEKNVLADAPQTALIPHEVEWKGETYVLNIPANAKLEHPEFMDEVIHLTLASGARAGFVVGHYNMDERKKTMANSGFSRKTRLKQFIFKGEDLLLYEKNASTEKRFNGYMSIADGPQQFRVRFKDTVVKYGDISLPDLLLLMRCAITLRVKTPFPEDPVALIKRLRFDFEPRTDNPAEVTSLKMRDYVCAEQIKLVEKFPNLQSLHVSMTWLDHTSDTLQPLSNCEKLTQLVIIRSGGRSAVSQDFESIGKCSALEELQLGMSSSKADDFRAFGNLVNLKTLKMSDIKEAGIDGLNSLSACQNLTDLELDFGIFSDFADKEPLRFLQSLPQLTSLKVKSPYADPGNVREANSLETLTFESKSLKDDHLKSLSTLSSLKRLTLVGATYSRVLAEVELKGNGLESIANLPQLQELYLKGLPLLDDSLKHLHQAKSLEKLSLDLIPLTYDALLPLKDVPKLKELSFNRMENLNSVLINDLREAMPQIKIR